MKNVNSTIRTPLLLQVVEVQVKYRNKILFTECPKINCSGDAEKILRANWGDDMELVDEFNVLFLTCNRKLNMSQYLQVGMYLKWQQDATKMATMNV